MSSVTDFYYINAYISPDFIPPGTKITKSLRTFLTAKEMKDMEMAYNTTKTNSVEIIYRHEGDKAQTESSLLGVLYSLDYVPNIGLNAFIAMKNNKKDERSRRMHAKIKAGTLREVSIQFYAKWGTDKVTKDLIIVDHIALLDIPSYFAYAQKTTGGGSFIKHSSEALFPQGKPYSLDISRQRLRDFLNSKKTVGQFSIVNRSLGTSLRNRPLAVRRDFSMSDTNADATKADTGKDDVVMEEGADSSPNPTNDTQTASVSDAINRAEKDISDLANDIKTIEDELKNLKNDKSPEAKGNEQKLLASLESLKNTKSEIETSRDQLVKSGGLEASTIEHLLKTSKEASINSNSVKEAVSSLLEEIMQDLSEDARKKIDHSVATNQDTKDIMTTVMASFVNSRKRKTPDGGSANEDVPASKRTKLEDTIDGLRKDMDEIKRGFAGLTAAAAAKTTPISEILQQAKATQDRAKQSAAEFERISRQYGGSSTPSKKTAGTSQTSPPPKSRGRIISDDEASAKLHSHQKLTEMLSKTTNSSMPH